mgnify:CR=1 FL=1
MEDNNIIAIYNRDKKARETYKNLFDEYKLKKQVAFSATCFSIHFYFLLWKIFKMPS